jgi:predicted phage terminase large subunit-like protein
VIVVVVCMLRQTQLHHILVGMYHLINIETSGALKSTVHNVKKLDLLVIRVTKMGDIGNARPCHNCLKMMKDIGIKKVFYSIRSVDKRNISILILNPTIKTHWIFKELFKKKNVPEGFCGVVDNVLYIHSSYLDVNPKFIPENIRRDYERMKADEPEIYKNVVLGGWINEQEGALFKRSELNYYDPAQVDWSESIGKIAFIDVADTGEDNHAVPVGTIVGNRIYIQDVVFTKLGTDVNVDLTASFLNEHKPEFVRIESNFGGSMYLSLLQPKVQDDITLLSIRATTNKIGRIIQLSGFMKKYCYFRNDIEIGSDYDKFIENIFEFTADGKAPHDDAPDALEGLCSMARSFHPYLWQ